MAERVLMGHLRQITVEEAEEFARLHGIPALLDHLGLDGLGNEANQEQITLNIATGGRHPPTMAIKATPLWISEDRMVAGGETFEVKFEMPEGVDSTRVAFVLVKIDV